MRSGWHDKAMTRLLGVVLAGGKSRRFGQDKALALLSGEPLLTHSTRLIAPHVADVVLSRAEPVGDMIAISDRPRSDLGPLGGLCGTLHHAAANGYDAVLTIGCDMPLVDHALLAQVSAHDGAAFVMQAPTLGRWPVALAERLEQHLRSSDDRSLRRWGRVVGAKEIDAGGDLANVNALADLTHLMGRAGG